MGRQAGAHILFGHAPGHRPLDGQLLGGRDQYHGVQVVLGPATPAKQGQLEHDNGGPGRRQLPGDFLVDQRVGDGLQGQPFPGVGEHNGGQGLAVEVAVRSAHAGTEVGEDGLLAGATRFDDAPRHLVGVDHGRPLGGQGFADRRSYLSPDRQ